MRYQIFVLLETARSSTFTLTFLLALRQNLCTDYIIYFRDNLCEKKKSASISGAQLKLSLSLYFCRKGTRVLDLAVMTQIEAKKQMSDYFV
jgi:hypothetical protein